METGDFCTIESMSFTFSGSGFDVVADQCVLVWRDIDVNQDFSAAPQPQATTTLSETHAQSANMISDITNGCNSTITAQRLTHSSYILNFYSDKNFCNETGERKITRIEFFENHNSIFTDERDDILLCCLYGDGRGLVCYKCHRLIQYIYFTRHRHEPSWFLPNAIMLS